MSRSYRGLATGAIADKFVLVEGRRGTAKTRSILSILVQRGLAYPGRRSLLARSTRTRLSDTVLTTLGQQVLPAFGLQIPAGQPENWHRIPLGNGSELLPMGLEDPQRSQSMEVADIYVAEGVELAKVEDVTTLAGALRQAGQPQWQCIVDCNPGPPRHWLNEIAEPFPDSSRRIINRQDYERLLRHNNSPTVGNGWKRVVTTWQDNPGYFDTRAWEWTQLGQDYRKTLDSLTGHWLARWRDGLWVSAEGAVFPEFSEAIHVVDDFTPPADWPWYVGVDPGFAHPTGAPWVCVSPVGDLYVGDEIYEGGKSIAQHVETILRMCTGRTVRKWFGDPHEFFSNRAQGESWAVQSKKAGLPTFMPWAAQEKGAMVNAYRQLLQNSVTRANTGVRPGVCLYVMRRCKNVIMEHQSWAFKRNAKGELAGGGDDLFADENNHLVGDPLVGMCATGQLRYYAPGNGAIELANG